MSSPVAQAHQPRKGNSTCVPTSLPLYQLFTRSWKWRWLYRPDAREGVPRRVQRPLRSGLVARALPHARAPLHAAHIRDTPRAPQSERALDLGALLPPHASRTVVLARVHHLRRSGRDDRARAERRGARDLTCPLWTRAQPASDDGCAGRQSALFRLGHCRSIPLRTSPTTGFIYLFF